ncbi:MAG: hypothetical protein LBI53_02360 [Candidatus Peribacteria bacterium]|nr:hypothetical protein [Candidatus Peribacteria bacterium]
MNTKHQIATYGYNPENQYLQIIMEYGIIGLLFRLTLLLGILGYTGYLMYHYRKTKKSAKQTFIYYSLLALGI